MAKSMKVGALWLKTSKDGKTKYFSGVINAGIFGDIQISILKNTFKEKDSNQPDYNILLVEPMPEQKPVAEDETPEEPDDDIPF
jgi:hypothetical protein